METNEVLFIGGSYDSRRMFIDPNEHRISVPVYVEGRMQSQPEWYRRHRLNTTGQLISVFVAEQFSLHEAMIKLIENYHPRADYDAQFDLLMKSLSPSDSP